MQNTFLVSAKSDNDSASLPLNTETLDTQATGYGRSEEVLMSDWKINNLWTMLATNCVSQYKQV